MVEQQVTEQPIEAQAELALSEQAAPAPTEDSAKQAAFDIDGEQVTADQIKAWKAGHLMQSDYTRKMQELSQQRDSLKPYEEMAGYLQANPDKAQQIYNYLQGQPLAQEDADPREMKINQLERTVQNLVYQTSQREATQRLNEIKNEPKYNGLFNNPQIEELLISRALQTKDYNLKSSAEAIHKAILDMKADTKLETEKQIQANLKSPTRKGGGAGGAKEPPAQFNPSNASPKDLDALALDMLS